MSSRLSVKSVFAKIRKEEWIRRTEPIPKWNILRGDTVFLRSGKDKGVLEVCGIGFSSGI